MPAQLSTVPPPPSEEKPTIRPAVQPPRVPVGGKANSLSANIPYVAPHGRDWLSASLLDLSPTRPERRTNKVAASVVFHIVILATLILPPLFYTQTIDLKQFSQTFLVAPPPPPPPPPPPTTKVTQTPPRVLLTPQKLMAPTVIPKTIAIIKDEPLPPDAGVMGGVPGGVPGGQLGGVIGGIVSDAARAVMPAPPPRAPIRVGGRIKAPRALSQPQPIYPALARQARVTGVVSIDAVIDTTGNVTEVKAVSGPPLLMPAALEAVRQWKYEPTYLNDEPVAVELIVTVMFHLD